MKTILTKISQNLEKKRKEHIAVGTPTAVSAATALAAVKASIDEVLEAEFSHQDEGPGPCP